MFTEKLGEVFTEVVPTSTAQWGGVSQSQQEVPVGEQSPAVYTKDEEEVGVFQQKDQPLANTVVVCFCHSETFPISYGPKALVLVLTVALSTTHICSGFNLLFAHLLRAS